MAGGGGRGVMAMAALKAILFDMDDTLLDWSGFKSDWAEIEALHLSGVIEYLRDELGCAVELDAFARELRERTTQAWAAARQDLRAPHLGRLLCETALALGAPREALDADRCLRAYRWDAIIGTAIFPDVPPLLTLLHDHGIGVGIVTNAYQPMVLREIELRTHRLLDFFPTCRLSAADVGYLKPHPYIFKAALECAGVEPHETVFIGDDLHADILGAQRAGIKAVLRITSRVQDGSGLIHPDAAVSTFDELPAILDDWFPGWRD
jgi:putative hydrolase of the HAD superfamily